MAAHEDRKKPSTGDDEERPSDPQDEIDDDEDLEDDDEDLEDDDEDDDLRSAADEADDDLAEHADARAAQVAKALGLDEEEAAEAEEAEAPKNRAARRRDEAQRRRGTRRRQADEGDEAGEASPQRDRNKRLREQLLKRRREAAREQAKAAQAQGLAPSEMAEDVLVRASASATKWLARHKALVGWSLFAILAVTAGVLYYVHRADTTTAAASDLLTRAVVADQALLLREEEDTRTEEQKEYDVREYFPSAEQRSKAALEKYEQVAAEHAGTGAAILAELGRAGALLDGHQYDDAIAAYEGVLGTELAPVDADVRGRALEGLLFAREGKKDLDGALATAQKLEAVEGFKALGQYHRARIMAAKGTAQEEIKGVLVEARKTAEKDNADARTAGGEAPHRWLLEQIEERLRAIDPNAVPPKAPTSPGAGPDMERLRQMLEARGLSAPQLPPPGGAGK